MNTRGFFRKRSKLFWGITGLVLLGLIGLVDHYTGHESNMILFYLVPVSLYAWFINGRFGLIMSGASALTWFIADFSAGLDYSISSIFVWNTLILLGSFVVVSTLLSVTRKEYIGHRESARRDYLTGAANIRQFYELVQQEINRAKRSKLPITLAFIDIDNFKQVNDRLGHGAGNRLLQGVVEGIKGQIRSMDIFARMGGDEFALLLPETGQEGAKHIISRIHQGLAERLLQEKWRITFSIGVVTFLRPLKDVDEMLKVADKAMYSVKKSTKNRINYRLCE